LFDLSFSNDTDFQISKLIFENVFSELEFLIKERKIISLSIVSDKEIKKINFKFRNKNKVTDVLSFSYLDKIDNFCGEIFISAKTAFKQSQENKIDFNFELKKLFIHAVLHIFGFDHKKKKDREKMEKIEKQILKKI